MAQDGDVVRRMAAIGEHGDVLLAHLLLVAPWRGNYLRTRFPGARTPPLQWEQERARRAPRFLGGRDGEPWLALDRIARPHYNVAGLVQQVLHFADQELGIVGSYLPEMVEAPRHAVG